MTPGVKVSGSNVFFVFLRECLARMLKKKKKKKRCGRHMEPMRLRKGDGRRHCLRGRAASVAAVENGHLTKPQDGGKRRCVGEVGQSFAVTTL